MKKKRSILRQVPWASWEEWDWVANELFSDSPGRIRSASNRIAAWQSRGHVPVAVEISAGLVAIHQRDSEVIQGGSENADLPQDLLRMMYAMAIQRLVNGVVDQSRKYATSSIADRAEATGLPRVLVDIRHEAAHGELPELSLLQVASKQALAWLKLHYWEKQRETLKQARATLKSKLLDHCHLVAEILSPIAPALENQHSKDEESSDANVDSNLESRQREVNRARKQRMDVLFTELLDLSLSSPLDLVSIIADDGLLTGVSSLILDKAGLAVPGSTGSSELNSTLDIAWKFTMRELSFHLPRLPAMLLIAIIKHITSSLSDGKSLKADIHSVPLPQSGANMIAQSCRSRNRLTSWCIWLLGKGVSKNVTRLSGKDLRQLKLLQITVAPSVKVEFDEELLGELLRLCLRTAVCGSSLVEMVPLIARKLGGGRFQQRTSALAHLGSRLGGTKEYNTEILESQSVVTQIAEEVPVKDGLEAGEVSTTPCVDNGNHSSTRDELSLSRAKSLQKAFFARLSSSKAQSQAVHSHRSIPTDRSNTLREQGSTPSSPAQEQESSHAMNARSSQGNSGVKRWKIIENWRPCAIGMIPALGHCAGIVPSLELRRPVLQSEPLPSEQMDGTTPVGSGNKHLVNKEGACLGKRTSEHQRLHETSKRPKTGLHVRFDLSNDVGVETTLARPPKNLRGSMLSNALKANQKEQTRSGSLVRGCLLQQGALKLVTPEQMQAFKTAVRIL